MAHDDLYDLMAERYIARNESGPYNALYERPALLELLGDQSGQKVLDLGCGPGLVSAALMVQGAAVTAVDRSAAMISAAAHRLGQRASVIQHDIESPLPFPDGSFDTVAAGLVLHYLPDWAGPLAEIRRVLVPGGRMVASVHHPLTDQRVATMDPAGHGAYLESYTLIDRWDLDGTPVDVTFWHHPLGRMTTWITDSGLALTDIVEPRPTDEMARTFPAAHALLSAEPAFLLLAAQRPASP